MAGPRTSLGSFRDLAQLVLDKSRVEPADLRRFLAAADAPYWSRAEWFHGALRGYLAEHDLSEEQLVEAFHGASGRNFKRVIEFWRTGLYPDREGGQARANEQLYADRERMRRGMVVLALTQFLWPQHYRLYSFFIDCLTQVRGTVRSYLEVGPGHGLFLATAADLLEQATVIKAVDISEGSLQVSADLFRHFGIAKTVTFQRADAMCLDEHAPFDFITAGEIIEHLDDPGCFLRKVVALLSPDGRCFLSTCANCPDPGHVYQFNDVQEIRDLVIASGFEVERECVASVADAATQERIGKPVSTSYAALVTRRSLRSAAW